MRSLLMAGFLLLVGTVLPAQNTETGLPAISIRVEGDVPHPYTLTSADLKAMPRREVSVSDHGTVAKFEGVPISALLERAGLELGGALRGPRLTSYVLIEAVDGYRVLFAIAELDSAFTSKVVLVADRMNGAALPADTGPARVIVSDEKRASRWIRQVMRIRVLSAPASEERSGVRTPP